MQKEILIALAAALGVTAVAGGWFLLKPASEPVVIEQVIPIEQRVDQEVFVEPDYDVSGTDDFESDNSGEVTRITIEDPEGGSSDVREILSEKVIVNDEVVDKAVSVE